MAEENTIDGKINANLDGLENILKGLMKDYKLRVGIIGSKAKATGHPKSKATNAEIGSFHEFGTKNMPRRSFLLDPLEHNLDFTSSKMKPMRKVLFKQFFDKGAPQKFFYELGAKAMDIINEAFDTQGWSGGAGWAPLSEATLYGRMSKLKSKKKREELYHNHKILQDTGKMKNSISFKVYRTK